MLTLAEFNDLEEGDLVQTVPLLAGVSQNPTHLTVVQVSSDKLTREFETSYFGITLGRWVCTLKNDQLVWSF